MRGPGSNGSSAPSAAMRSRGSVWSSSLRSAGSVSGRKCGWARVTAVARTMGGNAGSCASAIKEGKAVAPCVAPAWKVVPTCGRARQVVPYHWSIAVAAQSGLRSVWHWVQAFGVPMAFDTSGRGTRMAWSRRASTTM
jgi:hypothetical protein